MVSGFVARRHSERSEESTHGESRSHTCVDMTEPKGMGFKPSSKAYKTVIVKYDDRFIVINFHNKKQFVCIFLYL